MPETDLPPLAAVRAFEAAARHLSATKAAEELSVTLGAVSHQIRAMEDFLGVKLFVRGHRQLRLTARGEMYYRQVAESFDTLRSATSVIRQSGGKRALRIRAQSTFSLRWLIPRLSTYYLAHKKVELVLSTSNEPVDFVHDQLDMAILLGTGDWPGVQAERLVPNRLTPVCSPALLERAPRLRTPSDLRRHVLLHSTWPQRRDDWRDWLRERGIAETRAANHLHYESSALAYQAALEGHGIAMAQVALVDRDIAAGRLVRPFEETLDRGAHMFYLVYPAEGRMTPEMRDFRAWLLEQAGMS